MLVTVHLALEINGEIEITSILITSPTVQAVPNHKFATLYTCSLVPVTPRSCAGETKSEDCASETLCLQCSLGQQDLSHKSLTIPERMKCRHSDFPHPFHHMWFSGISRECRNFFGKHNLVLDSYCIGLTEAVSDTMPGSSRLFSTV